MFPAQPSDFGQSPMPWSSAIVHDVSGHPAFAGPKRPMQYFVDRDGNPVRSASGKLVHVQTDDDGRPVLDNQGKPILIDVPIGPDGFDQEGNPLRRD